MAKDKSFLRPKTRSYMQRSVDKLPVHQRFLIVCEGEKTEPNYFRKFRVPVLVIQVEGLGVNTLSLVQETIILRTKDDYDQVWCVFDKDDFPDKNFNEAITLAKRNGIRVAYSNQSFELWYVLHFCYLQNSITRRDYMKLLDENLGHPYEKKSSTIFDELRSYQTVAIRNAKRLISQYHPRRPAKDDPSTTVFELVEQLLEHSKPFGVKR